MAIPVIQPTDISTISCNFIWAFKKTLSINAHPQYDEAVGGQFHDLHVLTPSLRTYKDLDRLLLFQTYLQVEISCLCASRLTHIRRQHDEITYLLQALWLVCCSK